MKRFLQTSILTAAILLLAFGAASAVSPDVSRDQKAEKQASAALTKLRIPLQRDAKGIVRWIESTEGEFTDDAMPYLAQLPNLEWLEIGKGSVTSAGTAQLKGCTGLKRLYLHDIDLTGDTLDWLQALKNLEALSLKNTKIDGKSLKNVTELPVLAVLNVSDNNIQDEDMGSIAALQGLEVLSLTNTKITGAGIAKLEGMRSLNELNVVNCDIRDSDLSSFLTMPNLRIVYAAGCYLNDIAIQQTISRFPMLAIFR
jgi:Leucine-rich repeat (LRR) protein